jgi:PAS domain S-box-containing protein
MVRNGDRLLTLIERILDFTRLDEPMARVSRTDTDVSAFMRGIIESVDSAARARGIGLSFFDGTDSLRACIDRDLTEKAVLNLLSNALKFTPNGGSIAVELAQNPGAEFSISVRDNGIGIPDEALPFVFDRFYQADSLANRRYPGAGLGLALTKRVVELQGGSISAASKPGKGSAFVIRLPLSPADPSAMESVAGLESPSGAAVSGYFYSEHDGARADAAGPGTMETPAAKGPLALIVEDNADMRAFIKASIGRNFRFSEAEDGYAGLEAIAKEGPDIILVDVMMPRMDGPEFLDRVRAAGRCRGVPIIVISARAEPSDRLGAIEAGAVDYIVKPFPARELAAKARSLLELKKLGDELSARAAELALSEERAKEIADFAAAGIVETDASGRLTYANNTARRLLGCAPGASFLDYVAETDRDRMRGDLSTGLAPGDRGFPIPRLIRADGTTSPALIKVTAAAAGEERVRIAFLDFHPMAERVLRPDDSFFKNYHISEREKEVIDEMLRGLSIREIADHLFISETTVKTHQQNIYGKMGINSKKELFAILRQNLMGRFGPDSLAYNLMSGFAENDGPRPR